MTIYYKRAYVNNIKVCPYCKRKEIPDDADIYYIEGAYYDSKLRGNQYGLPNGFMQAKEAYERAIKCGHPYAAKALARMKSKWGIR